MIRRTKSEFVFAALGYNQIVALQSIDPEADFVKFDANKKDQNVDATALAESQVVDVFQAMTVCDHWILVNMVVMSKVSTCLHGGDINSVVDVFRLRPGACRRDPCCVAPRLEAATS